MCTNAPSYCRCVVVCVFVASAHSDIVCIPVIRRYCALCSLNNTITARKSWRLIVVHFISINLIRHQFVLHNISLHAWNVMICKYSHFFCTHMLTNAYNYLSSQWVTREREYAISPLWEYRPILLSGLLSIGGYDIIGIWACDFFFLLGNVCSFWIWCQQQISKNAWDMFTTVLHTYSLTTLCKLFRSEFWKWNIVPFLPAIGFQLLVPCALMLPSLGQEIWCHSMDWLFISG